MNYSGNDYLEVMNTKLFDTNMMFSESDLLFLDYIIHDSELNHIVELGTGNGGLTLLLGLWMHRDLEHRSILTIDNKFYCGAADSTYKLFKLLGIKALDADENDPETLAYIENFIKDKERVLFICDGGSKFKNFMMMGSIARKDDVIACHDCVETFEDYERMINEGSLGPVLTEMGIVSPKQVLRAMEMYGLEEVYIKDREFLLSAYDRLLFKAFKRIPDANTD